MQAWLDQTFLLFQRLLPTRALGTLIFKISRWRAPWAKNLLIKGFIRIFRVDTSESVGQAPDDFTCLNDFFTRALKVGARPLAGNSATWISPVDGTISQCGPIHQGQLFQAKGHHYGLADLLTDPTRAAALEGGWFATVYLAPWNYHRIHAPMDGVVLETLHMPGKLYAVNPATERVLPGLFALNERVICHMEGSTGPWTIVLVGALNVGSISTEWAGEVRHGQAQVPGRLSCGSPRQRLSRGDLLGRFNLGSTIILLIPKGKIAPDTALTEGRELRLGQALGAAPP